MLRNAFARLHAEIQGRSLKRVGQIGYVAGDVSTNSIVRFHFSVVLEALLAQRSFARHKYQLATVRQGCQRWP